MKGRVGSEGLWSGLEEGDVSVQCHCMHSGCETPVASPPTLLLHPLSNLPALWLAVPPLSRAAQATWSSKSVEGRREGGRWLVCSLREEGGRGKLEMALNLPWGLHKSKKFWESRAPVQLPIPRASHSRLLSRAHQGSETFWPGLFPSSHIGGMARWLNTWLGSEVLYGQVAAPASPASVFISVKLYCWYGSQKEVR